MINVEITSKFKIPFVTVYFVIMPKCVQENKNSIQFLNV